MKPTKYFFFALPLLFGLIFTGTTTAQSDADNYKTTFKFYTYKQADNTRLLEVSFTGRNKDDRKDIVPVYDADVHFYNVTDSSDIELGVVKTDNSGYARLVMPADYRYITDEEGFINLKASFKGTDEIRKASRKASVKDIFLEMVCEEVDSVKTVKLYAQTVDSANTRVPVEEADVVFSIGGMLSKMTIEDETLENGEYEFEFPENIPGDKNGMITIYATIQDHDDFGNVACMQQVDWGVFDDQPVESSQTLWSDVAPTWMYIVLSIMLIGVWANYVYSIVNLFKIKKEGNEG
jgi:hypothetical protein